MRKEEIGGTKMIFDYAPWGLMQKIALIGVGIGILVMIVGIILRSLQLKKLEDKQTH